MDVKIYITEMFKMKFIFHYTKGSIIRLLLSYICKNVKIKFDNVEITFKIFKKIYIDCNEQNKICKKFIKLQMKKRQDYYEFLRVFQPLLVVVKMSSNQYKQTLAKKLPPILSLLIIKTKYDKDIDFTIFFYKVNIYIYQ